MVTPVVDSALTRTRSNEGADLALKARDLLGGGKGIGLREEGMALVVTVRVAHHLPKKDPGPMGRCDAFAVVSFAGQTRQTRVINNTYDAEFNESFEFKISRGAHTSLQAIQIHTGTLLDSTPCLQARQACDSSCQAM
jgi:hypothetical protein